MLAGLLCASLYFFSEEHDCILTGLPRGDCHRLGLTARSCCKTVGLVLVWFYVISSRITLPERDDYACYFPGQPQLL